MDERELARRFDYHPPNDSRRVSHEHVRSETKGLAALYGNMLPEGREKALALTKLEEAQFWANAAIAREGA